MAKSSIIFGDSDSSERWAAPTHSFSSIHFQCSISSGCSHSVSNPFQLLLLPVLPPTSPILRLVSSSGSYPTHLQIHIISDTKSVPLISLFQFNSVFFCFSLPICSSPGLRLELSSAVSPMTSDSGNSPETHKPHCNPLRSKTFPRKFQNRREIPCSGNLANSKQEFKKPPKEAWNFRILHEVASTLLRKNSI
ncbi:hypothetical protein SDJN03_16913, partial [Cucurbita argyrosperma subsp. sororia]